MNLVFRLMAKCIDSSVLRKTLYYIFEHTCITIYVVIRKHFLDILLECRSRVSIKNTEEMFLEKVWS